MTEEEALDVLAVHIRGLNARGKITLARDLLDDLLDARARMYAKQNRELVAVILRMAADEVEAGR